MAIQNQLPPRCEHLLCDYPKEDCAGFCKAQKPIREGDQPMPVANDKPAVWPIVMADMQSRHELGIKRYGTPLQPHNGRDTLRDAYEEALDLAVYLRTAIYERDGK